jgi:ApbE superfamily uncharacterized protein (UPF0280 family)
MSRQAFLSAHRAYRESVLAQPGERRFQVVLEQTDLMVTAETDLSGPMLDMARVLRGELKNYMLTHPGFRESLVPFPVQDDAPEIVREMARASALANVGPMAAVAGTIAQLLAERFAPLSPNLIVENGGDIFMTLTAPVTVAVHAGDSPLSDKIALQIKPEETPLALCCSSGTVGHSLSFGMADACMIACPSGALADAFATAFGNEVKHRDQVQQVTEMALQKPGILSVVIIAGDKAGLGGTIKVKMLQAAGRG